MNNDWFSVAVRLETNNFYYDVQALWDNAIRDFILESYNNLTIGGGLW